MEYDIKMAPYGQAANFFHVDFEEAYWRRKNEKHFRHDLPMLTRNWRISFIEAKRLWMLLDFKPGQYNPTGMELRVEWKDEMPELADLDDVEAIARAVGLGEVIDGRVYPFEIGVLSAIQPWAAEWATTLADRHMARTHPGFEEAQTRMTEAYRKLFELEHFLRAWIDQTLTAAIGADWWDKARIDPGIKVVVTRNQADTRGASLDVHRAREQSGRARWRDPGARDSSGKPGHVAD